jgi:hypothetical protein
LPFSALAAFGTAPGRSGFGPTNGTQREIFWEEQAVKETSSSRLNVLRRKCICSV